MESNINEGDRVKCINAKPIESGTNPIKLIEGRDYIIYRVKQDCCGKTVVDVGLPDDTNTPGRIGFICNNCKYISNDTTAWRLVSRFRKVEEKKEEKVIYRAVTVPETLEITIKEHQS